MMHIGNFLKSEAQKQRFTISEIAKEVNKTPQAVRKDFKKDTLHMSVLESFAKLLNINVYEILAKEWGGENYIMEEKSMEVSEPTQSKLKSKKSSELESISITFNITPDKKESILKLLTS